MKDYNPNESNDVSEKFTGIVIGSLGRQFSLLWYDYYIPLGFNS